MHQLCLIITSWSQLSSMRYRLFGNIFNGFFTWKGHKWAKEFNNRPSKICGRQPLKNLSHFRVSFTNVTWSIVG